MNSATLGPLVGDLRQFASVRRIVLDDGAERGVRALLFSTGGGLDFMVLTDRSLDLGTLSFKGLPLAWQSPAGFRSPFLTHAESEGGRGFNRSFSGLLMTCGLDHIRQPGNGQPLHGRLPGTPARLTGYGEDWERDEPVLFCEGEMVQASYGAESLRLRRRIEAPIGGRQVRIIDRVDNCGAEPWPQDMLYHLNLGYPGIADGTRVDLNGAQAWGPLRLADATARPDITCLAAGPAAEAKCVVTTPSPAGEVAVSVGFDTETLPFLQLWRDLRPRAGVLAIEPCSSARRPDGSSEPMTPLRPGESRSYRLSLEVTRGPVHLTAGAPA